MCNSKIDGRPVLQPAGNRVSSVSDNTKFIKKPASPTFFDKPSLLEKSVLKRGNDPNSLNSSGEKPPTSAKTPTIVRKKSKKVTTSCLPGFDPAAKMVAAAGSIAAAQREQASLMQKQRKLRVAHYGRTAAKLQGKVAAVNSGSNGEPNSERCSFITSNSDPLYVAYHDEEWGAPVHDDKVLFELLVLCGFQVGLDWTTILKKRKEYSDAFAGFEAEVMAKFTDKQISSICSEYGMEEGKVRGVVGNANRIIEVTKDFDSFDKYIWGFVNYKPLYPNYKSCRKIPAKTSKSESISKDLVRRGFRFVGPTVIHSFMQAAGLTNDHLLSCRRRHHLLPPH